MNRKILIGALGLVLIFLATGLWLYNWVLGDTQAASEPITAPTIVVEVTKSNPQPVAKLSTQQTEATATSLSSQITTGNETETVIFEINPSDSEVRFIIFEILRGAPTDVIGISNQVAGQISVDLSDLSKTQIGEILVNARTLATDDERRNQAIRNRILNTDQYEFIRFEPVEIIGLVGKAVPGEPFNFQISGDLTIREITQRVIFDVTMTGENLERITGFAKTTIQRSDFHLNIPDVPFVADVGEDVVIEIDLLLEVK